MIIQAWNIVLNTVIAVVLVVYGLWLRNIVTQQLKSKDTAILALEAVIKIKDAEISALKSDTAPSITKAYAEMREHADKMTAEVLRLSEQLTKAVEDGKRLQQATKEAQERTLVDLKTQLESTWENTLNEQLKLFWSIQKKGKETE